MFEYEIMMKNDEIYLIHGYTLEDACRRNKLNCDEVKYILYKEYID